MKSTSYDVIVLGVGGIGSSALLELASRGLRVLGIDRFPPGHDRGSSHGDTRVIRKAYFEHPDYVPLLFRAYENWRALESRVGKRLLFEVGLLEVGPADGVLMRGLRAAVEQHQLPLEMFTSEEAERRFPGFVIPENSVAAFEPEGGYLLVEECIKSFVSLGLKLGAELQLGEDVHFWESDGKTVRVHYSNKQAEAAKLVIAAGAWAGELLTRYRPRLRVVRKHLHWYRTLPGAYSGTESPVFFYETADGYFYGFPSLDGESIKVAEHSGGRELDDPLNASRDLDPIDQRRVEEFLSTYVPQLAVSPSGRLEHTHHSPCMYTLTPDENFLVDRHPDYGNVCFAGGLSGHGFKFASVLGEVLADLAVTGQTEQPIDFLRGDRFG